MRIALLLLSCFGPPLLMAMGIAVCAFLGEPPHRRWVGLVAFLAVGIPVSAAAYLETQAGGGLNGGTSKGVARADAGPVAAGTDRRVRAHQSGPQKLVFVIVPQTRQTADRSERVVRPNQSVSRYVGVAITPQTRPTTSRNQHGARSSQSGLRYVAVTIPSRTHATQAIAKTHVSGKNAPIPPNTLSCKGFTRDEDGFWEAGDDTEPFDVGSDTNFVIRDQGPISRNWMSVGDVDLYALLTAKCGKAAKSPS